MLRRKILQAIGMSLFSCVALAAPRISIIIDDLGNNYYQDQRVANLPGAVACSVLPRAFFSRAIAEQCHAQHKTVMLHVPMQAIRPHYLGAGGLTVAMNQAQFTRILEKDLAAVPYVSGVNNHMGSLLTQRAADMRWLMQVIKARNLFFVDSRTSSHTLAYKLARMVGVPAAKRDVFLDNIPRYAAIDREFQRLLALARSHGWAIAIGHPYPATLTYLEQHLPELQAQGVQLVAITELLDV